MIFAKKADPIPLIQVRNLVKKFDAQTVLNGVDLDIAAGDLRVIMGPSGCGKSTLLRCFNRLVEPTSGSIVFSGQNIMDDSVDVRALRQSIGFVFQQFAATHYRLRCPCLYLYDVLLE